MAVFPSVDTVTDVVAMMYFTPEGQNISPNINYRSPYQLFNDNELLFVLQTCSGVRHKQTFVIHWVVVEFSRSVFYSQAVPQREVIDGEQIIFISWSQELPTK